MAKKNTTKCGLKGFCPSLDRVLGDWRMKGLVEGRLFSVKNCKPARSLIAYNPGIKGEKPTPINYCPFCGGDPNEIYRKKGQ